MRPRLTAPRLLLVSFAALIGLGTLLLALPVSAAGGESVGLLDAMFTSTSAVCVTGLATLDTSAAWSPFGQVVVLLLIQVGGLGILTLSTFVALSLGRRVSVSQHELMVSSVTPLRGVDALRIVRRILAWTLGAEALGTISLWLAWRDELGGAAALWHALFHSVSAFCNAGFSTFSDGLLGYRGDVAVNATVIGLILVGGIGFVVLLDLENRVRYRDRLGLHTRIVLVTTAGLVVAGAALFYACEARNTLHDGGLGESLMAALFASVTARTAGFNTVDYGVLTTPALALTVFLMFVGGSPGSCAGGVKTTTLAVLVATARSALKGRARPQMFQRTIPAVAVRQALVLAVLGLTVLFVSPFILEFTEVWSVPYTSTSHRYLELWFEAASAFGTTGLSTGVTGTLTDGGKLVLIALMYVGRVGLLTVVVAIAHRRRRKVRCAEENVLVG